MQSIRDQLIGFATAKRTELITGANNGDDDDMPVDERPNRAEVSPGCLLKPFDEVEVWGTAILYLCPGRGLGWFYGLTIDSGIIPLGQYEAQYVSDRLPVDPLETPMPIFPEPPP